MPPRVITRVSEMQATAEEIRVGSQRLTMVPTMGYLHAGHASLIRRARRDGDVVVVSVFVNPTQFGPNEDFEDYPRDFDRDLQLIEANGGDIVFAPDAAEMYPEGYATHVDLEDLTSNLCAASRPTHFRGVATVVTKLFTACRPHAAVFGQKDAQQALVVQRLAKDLHLGVEILVSPTIREPDGLARSSRNVYLSASERAEAPALFHALQRGRKMIQDGERDRAKVNAAMRSAIERATSADVDYAEAVSAGGLREDATLRPPTLLAAAVRFGKARLIDNMIAK